MRKNLRLTLLVLFTTFFLPALAGAGCNINCPRGYCFTGEDPATCCCDFGGYPHCGVFDHYPCQGGWELASVGEPTGDPTIEGFLAYLAENPEPASDAEPSAP